MSYIFLDESGDIGFDFSKKGTSHIFVITCLFVEQKRPIEKLVRKIHGGLRKRYRRVGGTLHSYKEEPITRQRMLAGISKSDCRIMTMHHAEKPISS